MGEREKKKGILKNVRKNKTRQKKEQNRRKKGGWQAGEGDHSVKPALA